MQFVNVLFKKGKKCKIPQLVGKMSILGESTYNNCPENSSFNFCQNLDINKYH